MIIGALSDCTLTLAIKVSEPVALLAVISILKLFRLSTMPVNCPVALSKLAQAGLLTILLAGDIPPVLMG